MLCLGVLVEYHSQKAEFGCSVTDSLQRLVVIELAPAGKYEASEKRACWIPVLDRRLLPLAGLEGKGAENQKKGVQMVTPRLESLMNSAILVLKGSEEPESMTSLILSAMVPLPLKRK